MIVLSFLYHIGNSYILSLTTYCVWPLYYIKATLFMVILIPFYFHIVNLNYTDYTVYLPCVLENIFKLMFQS